MCRFLGIIAEGPTSFCHCLQEAPRSLAGLSREHPDGWGIALHTQESSWTLHRSVTRAGDDAVFEEVARRGSGDVLVAHVRQRTVGSVRIANTHPFRRGPWVFAHNGTIDEVDFLRRRTSLRRVREIEGETDSEILFAYLLSHIDDAGGAEASGRLDMAFSSAVSEIAAAAPPAVSTF